MLKTKNKLLLLTTLIGGLVYSVNAYSQSYMCLPCSEGTWSDGKSGDCKNLSIFSELGEKVAIYDDGVYREIEKTLEPGAYVIFFQGGKGGNGGNGGNGNRNFYSTGGTGQKGIAARYNFIINTPIKALLQIGANGTNGGSGHSNGAGGGGGGGGLTSFTLLDSTLGTISSPGGSGGYGGYGEGEVPRNMSCSIVSDAYCVDVPFYIFGVSNPVGGTGGYSLGIPNGKNGTKFGGWSGSAGKGGKGGISKEISSNPSYIVYKTPNLVNDFDNITCENGCIKIYKLK